MRVWTILIPALAAVAITGPARGQSSPKTDDRPLTDQAFVDRAAASGMAEVQMGKLGQEMAQKAAVKQFAARMVEDHTKANMQLLQIVADLKLTPAAAAHDADHDKAMKSLSGNKGADFDKAFMAQMVMDHEKAVRLFTQASRDLKNEQLKAFAAKTLPVIQEHLKMAKEISDKAGR